VTLPVKAGSPVSKPPALPPLATWVPAVHAAAGAALAALGRFWHPTPWAGPALVLAGALVFVIGTVLYIGHRDRWTLATADALLPWLESAVPELLGDVGALKAAAAPPGPTSPAKATAPPSPAVAPTEAPGATGAPLAPGNTGWGLP
jgi:hypothetical protein